MPKRRPFEPRWCRSWASLRKGFYGYPGYNMFEDMMSRDWSLNGMVGARLTWNIGALYTHKNDKAKIQRQRDLAENNREVFLFNNRLEQLQQDENISRYRQLMADDEEIISLVKEIKAENAAKVQQSIHEIEMLKEIYNKKYTTNQ